jgi:hypothetical protein
MLKRLAVLSALAFGSVYAAHATPISGTISLVGADTFTSSTITFFNPASILGGPGANTGTFSILTNGNPVTMFPGFVPPLPYTQGENTVPAAISPVEVMTTTEGGVTFSFFMTDYNAMFTDNTTGCLLQECLNVTGNGFFTATGFDNTPGSFVFTTQLAPGQTTTTFSASGFTGGITPIPEPATLALVGAGLLGMAGITGFARRKFSL